MGRMTDVLQKTTVWRGVATSYEPVSGIFIDRRGSNAISRVIDADSLANSVLPHADLRGADLSGRDLHEAGFPAASLQDADLRGANLRGADLSGAQGLANASLTGAIYDRRTRWPTGVDPERAGAVFVRADWVGPRRWTGALEVDH